MNGAPRIAYAPRPDATPETEVNTLAAVYKFALAKKNAAGVTSTNGDDAKKGSVKYEVRARQSIPRG